MSTTKAYEGSKPYIFVSYSHADWGLVMPIVAGLQDRGFRVWYDSGIKPGEHWINYIARHIDNCSCVLAFISRSWLNSQFCDQEICYTINHSKKFLPIYLENVSLPSGLQMQFATVQAMFLNRYDSVNAFLNDLTYASLLRPCCDNNTEHITQMERKSPEELVQEGLLNEQNKKHSAAMKCYQKVAEDGYAPAQYYLGRQYFMGGGVLADEKTAMKWFRKAAEQGYAEAQRQVGICYENGRGVIKDTYEAFRWYAKAADQDDAESQYHLGRCFEYGIGAQVDEDEAIEWYSTAYDNGYQKAGEKLNELARKGRINPLDAPPGMGDMEDIFLDGVNYYMAQNYGKAVECFITAARMGHSEAQEILRSSNVKW